MPVFISHTTADDELSRMVYDRLSKRHGIKCYIDDMDRQGTTSNVTALVVSRLKDCTNLVALVTQNTKASWWVPFEIGVAREAPRVITSFTNLDRYDLPEYLTEWPVLRGENAIDTFAEYYKRQAPIVERSLIEKFASESEGIAGVQNFHQRLKIALGQ